MVEYGETPGDKWRFLSEFGDIRAGIQRDYGLNPERLQSESRDSCLNPEKFLFQSGEIPMGIRIDSYRNAERFLSDSCCNPEKLLSESGELPVGIRRDSCWNPERLLAESREITVGI